MTHFVMLQRNLIYTGITRAKKICVLIGQPKALAYAIRNLTVSKRNTKLKERLRGEIEAKPNVMAGNQQNDMTGSKQNDMTGSKQNDMTGSKQNDMAGSKQNDMAGSKPYVLPENQPMMAAEPDIKKR